MLGSGLLCKRSDVSFPGRRSSSIRNLSYARGVIICCANLCASGSLHCSLCGRPRARHQKFSSGTLDRCRNVLCQSIHPTCCNGRAVPCEPSVTCVLPRSHPGAMATTCPIIISVGDCSFASATLSASCSKGANTVRSSGVVPRSTATAGVSMGRSASLRPPTSLGRVLSPM